MPPPPRKKFYQRGWFKITVVIVVVLVALFGLVEVLAYESISVDVTAINVTSSDNACGQNGHTYSGFYSGPGAQTPETFTIENSNFVTTCTVQSVKATTTGFSVSGENVPLSIPAGGSQSLSFTVTSANDGLNGFTGVLTIDLE